MLTTGHTAASYLISQTPQLKGIGLSKSEILFILFCGNIFDPDFFLLQLLGHPFWLHHHYLPTHTPLAGLIYLAILYLLLRNKFRRRIFLLAGVAMLAHLILDDLSYWFPVLGLELDSGTTVTLLRDYVTRAHKVFILEIVLTTFAILVAIVNKVGTQTKETMFDPNN